eukprot:1951779-Pyramimonas_sp.AAC.1
MGQLNGGGLTVGTNSVETIGVASRGANKALGGSLEAPVLPSLAGLGEGGPRRPKRTKQFRAVVCVG